MPAWFNEKPFSVVTPEFRKWWKRYSPEPMKEQFGSLAGKPWNNWGIEYAQQFPEMEPGKLWWPTGGSRFGVYCGIADKETVDIWREETEGTDDESVTRLSGQFNMFDLTNEMIQKNMYMLPPRPLPFYQTPKPIYLVTLVDYRYWWWFRNSEDLADDPAADWDDLFEIFRTTLGYDAGEWDYTTPVDAYQFPGDLIAKASHMPIAILIDAAAWSIGCRVVVDFDDPDGPTGKVHIMPLGDSIVNRNAAFPGMEVLSGGYFDMRSASSPLKDASCILPFQTTVSYERVDEATGEVVGRTAYTINTADVSGFSGYSLFGETVIYDTAQTTSSDADDTLLQDLTTQIVEAYLGHEAEANVNVTLAGIRYLLPCGLFDAVEFHEYTDELTEHEAIPDGEGAEIRIERERLMSYTKVTRHPYLWRSFTLHHYVSDGGGSGGSGGSGSGSGPGDEIICPDGTRHPFALTKNSNGTFTATVS